MENPNYRLEGVLHEKNELKDFEGPLSLILLLLKKNKIEIRDIMISDILDQYLEYIDNMQKMDLEVASEFIQMASYLIYIKTQMLVTADDEEISELDALIESLEQLKAKDTLTAVRSVIPDIQNAYKTGALFCSKPASPLPDVSREYAYKHDPADLLKALLSAFTGSGEKPADLASIRAAMPARIVYSVKLKSRQILEKLRLRSVSLDELYAECKSHSEIIAVFIAILELISMGTVSASVHSSGQGYELYSNGGDIDEILNGIEE